MVEVLWLVVILAFVLEYTDASFGAGYGTILASILILMKYDPLHVVVSVLFTNGIIGLAAGFVHYKAGNVEFKKKKRNLHVLWILTGFGVLGVLLASLVAINIPEIAFKIYLALLLIAMGTLVLVKRKKNFKFSKKRLMGMGALAAFNKGLTGGGYGVVLIGGQILSGIKSKSAIAMAIIAEAFVSLVGVSLYFIYQIELFNWSLIVSLLIGGITVLPLAALTVKKTKTTKLKFFIALINLVLGLIMIANVFFPFT